MHRKLGHIGVKAMKALLSPELSVGLPRVKLGHDPIDCISCKLGKMPLRSFKDRIDEELIQEGRFDADLMGPATPESQGGASYILVIQEAKTGFCWVYLLKDKSEAPQQVQVWATELHNKTQQWPRFFHTDRGGEFVAERLQESGGKSVRLQNSHCRTLLSTTVELND